METKMNVASKADAGEALLDDHPDSWKSIAAEFCRNMEFYRGIVWQVGDMFGIAARTSDDGSIQDDVLALKVPILVSDLIASTDGNKDSLAWAIEKWSDEVSRRPLVNVHRRTLDDTWRQVIRRFGGDDVLLCGPTHDQLLSQSATQSTIKADDTVIGNPTALL
jgi:hypothetical protein